MTETAPAPQQVGPPQPHPVPTAWALGVARLPDGTSLIGYQFYTPVGTYIVFLDLEQSEKLAEGIKSSVLQGRTGLTIAGADEMPREAPGGGVLLVR